MQFHSATLANGLQVVAECNGEAHSAAVGFFVSTGARDETDALAGVSHFLEHMVFKGTPTRTADDVNREFDEMGAHYNAFTSEEHTVYWASVLPEHVAAAVALLGDVLRPALRAEDFETEKKVILEEIRMYLDQPPYGADDVCRARHFGAHPLARSVLGTEQTVGRLAVEQMRDYHQARYSPQNVVAAAAGRIDFEALVADVALACGAWEPRATARELRPAAQQDGFGCMTQPASAQEYVLALSRGPSAADADRFAAKLLATVLGDDSGSRLFWELVDPGLAEQAVLSHQEYQDTGALATYLSCAPDATADNLQRVWDVYRRATADGVTQAELDQAKNKVNSRIVLAGERPRGRLFSVGGNWVTRREYRSVKDDLEAVDAVTRGDVAAVLHKHPLTRATIVCVGPLAEIAAPR